MTQTPLSAEDQARLRWRIPAGQPVLIKGSGDGKPFEDARHLANSILPELLRQDRYVKFKSLKELDTFLTNYGLQPLPSSEKPCNPPGRMIFYRKGLLLVRIKTRGNPPGSPYRANRPHLSVSLMNNKTSTEFNAEIVKFDPVGRPQPHTLSRKSARLLPIDATGRYDGDDVEWGGATHLEFDSALLELI